MHKKNHCMAVVDAGSTGSRLHVYSYSLNANNTPVNIQEVWVKTQSPGLATLPDDEAIINKYLNGLFEGFPLQQDTVIAKKMPLYFYGTAGMRLLPAQNQMYTKVKKHLQGNRLWKLKEARTITGTEEGVNGWLTINYYTGLLQQPKSAKAGYMDMGGASVQIVMPVAKKHFQEDSPDYVKLQINKRTYYLFVRSFLGLGQTQVTNQFLEKSHCYMPGYPMVNQQMGSGNAQACEENISRLINQVHGVDSIVQPVLHNNRAGIWYVTGGVVYTAKNKLFGLTGGFFNKNLLEKAESVCASDWEMLKNDQPGNTYLYNYCLSATYYHALMVKGYGFRPDTYIHFAEGNPDWPLGVVLQAGQAAAGSCKKDR